ncbi:MAG: DUF192 domain-containing protein [Candidatus Paceibacterota bacterium]|jgi:hypothetical protein
MNRYLLAGLVVLAVGVAAGLYRTAALEGPLAVSSPSVAEFGGVSLRLDYATTSESRERGLSGRASIPSDYGMLFVFPSDDRYGFWMRDTLVPLDIFWLDSKGQVVSLAEDVQPSSYPSVFYPSEPARYVLETSAGFASAHAVATGTPLLLKNFPTVLK